MNSCQKYFAACVLSLLTQAAFAQSAPALGTASGFAVLSAAPNSGGAVTCTDSTISGDVGSTGAAASVVRTSCVINGSVIAPVQPQIAADFNRAYDALKTVPCTETIVTPTLSNHTFAPGVYCFPAALTATNAVFTLDGPTSGVWIFKIGTTAAGALTATGLNVVLKSGAQACNVTWWVDAATSMTDSNLKGTVLSGAAITFTRGTLNGNALAKAAVTLTGVPLTGCANGVSNPPAKQHCDKGRGNAHEDCKDNDHDRDDEDKDHKKCNQGVGNGSEGCDPGNSNHGNPFNSNDERGGKPGDPGRKGGDKK
jgi:hypothetical protein